jgi:ribosomal protein S13
MAFLFETYIDENKSLHIVLTHIFGIGKHKAKNICYQLGAQPNCIFKFLSNSQYHKL